MVFKKIVERDERPTRLFIGGVHGKEGLTTIRALKKMSENSLKDGKLILINCPPIPSSEYISTLDRRYYVSKSGKRILSLIKEYEPDIYLELHCYRQDSYSKLTDIDRGYKTGVPPLIELEEDVLIGSVSPLIRITFFEKYDFSFVLEMPCRPSTKSLDVYSNILNMVARSSNRFEILDRLESRYPSAIEKARKLFLEFSDNFMVLFKETLQEIKVGDLNGPHNLKHQNLKHFIMNKAYQMGMDINKKQAEMIVRAVQLFQKYYPDSEIRKSWTD